MDSGSIVKCNLNNDQFNNKLKRIVTESPVLFLSAMWCWYVLWQQGYYKYKVYALNLESVSKLLIFKPFSATKNVKMYEFYLRF